MYVLYLCGEAGRRYVPFSSLNQSLSNTSMLRLLLIAYGRCTLAALIIVVSYLALQEFQTPLTDSRLKEARSHTMSTRSVQAAFITPLETVSGVVCATCNTSVYCICSLSINYTTMHIHDLHWPSWCAFVVLQRP